MNKHLDTREGIEKVISEHNVETGKRISGYISWGGHYSYPELAKPADEFRVTLRDVHKALKRFVTEHGTPDKKGNIVFKCGGRPDFHRRVGIGFRSIYPSLHFKSFRDADGNRYPYMHCNVSKVILNTAGEIIFRMTKKLPQTGSNEMKLDSDLINRLEKYDNRTRRCLPILNFILELYDDVENGGRFFYGVTGINGTPDSVVCVGVKK